MANLVGKVNIIDLLVDPLTSGSEPFLKDRKEYSKYISRLSNNFINLEAKVVESGMVSVENFTDEAVNSIPILRAIKSFDQSKYDAIILDCMGDPGLDAAREITDIPVLGPLESSAHVASIVGDMFGIVSIADSMNSSYIFALKKYGLNDKLIGIKSLNIPVLDIDKDRRKTYKRTLEALSGLSEMGANSVIIGCTGLVSFIEDLKKETKLQIIDPLAAAVGLAIQIKSTGSSISRRVWMKPSEKEFIGKNGGISGTHA